MTSLTDEIERFRQKMLEEARDREIDLVRLAAELEKPSCAGSSRPTTRDGSFS